MGDRLYLQDRFRREVDRILNAHVPDMEVWAYGSRVNGMAHEASDLDLVLRARGLEPVSAGRIEALREAFRESNIPIIVDVHDWAMIPESFHEEILAGYVTLGSVATTVTAPD